VRTRGRVGSSAGPDGALDLAPGGASPDPVVSRVILDIGENPERFPVWRQTWRRALLHRFPYVVFFMIDEDRVVVWAVAHTKRRPGYWVARRPPPRTP